MEDWQTRVVVEREELVGRLTKLRAYLDRLPPGPPPLPILYRQASAMSAYLSILDERIASWQ